MAQVFDPLNDFPTDDEPVYQQGLSGPQGARWRNGQLVGGPPGVPLAPPEKPSQIMSAAADEQEQKVRDAVLLQMGGAGYMLLRAVQMLKDAPSMADLLEWLEQGEQVAEDARTASRDRLLRYLDSREGSTEATPTAPMRPTDPETSCAPPAYTESADGLPADLLGDLPDPPTPERQGRPLGHEMPDVDVVKTLTTPSHRKGTQWSPERKAAASAAAKARAAAQKAGRP